MSLTIFDSPMLEQVVSFTEARHNVLAGNIANFDTPGYRMRDLSPDEFQAKLKEAVEASHAGPGRFGGAGGDRSESTRSAFEAVADTKHTLVFHDNSNMDIEQQAAELTKNQMEYNLALSLLTGNFKSLEAAISERA